MSTSLAYVRKLFRWSRRTDKSAEVREAVNLTRRLFNADCITEREALEMLEAMGLDTWTRERAVLVWRAIKYESAQRG